MPTYRVPLNDGRTVRVQADDPEAAALAAQDYQRAKPLPGARGQAGYVRARERISGNEAAARKARDFIPGGSGLTDFTAQIARSTGASDEVAGGITYLLQSGENLFRKATGQPITTTAEQAKLAAMDLDREAQARYARENPGKNAVATAAGIVASARPTGAAMIRSPIRAGAAAAAQTAPFALARQKGELPERLPGAALETGTAFGLGTGLTATGNWLGRRALAARNAPMSPQRQLAMEGVELTPGQMAGGSLRRIEDGLTSVPVLGDAIREAQIRGVDSLDRVAYNRTLRPIGASLPKTTPMGRKAGAEATKAISDAYDNAVANVTVAPDRQFSQDIQSALFSRQLPEDAAAEVNSVLNNSLIPKFTGKIDGRTWKDIDAELRAAIDAADAASANKPSMRYARDTLREVRKAFQGALQRSDAQAYAGVKAADEATANLVRIRQAGQYAGTAARGGRFTAGDLNRAVLANDSSAGNRNYFTGDALMQDLSDAAMEVMPQSVPDSGTPFRSGLQVLGGLGGLAAGGSALGAGAVTGPASIVAGGAALTGAALYSKPVQSLLNVIYRAKTPGMARKALGQLAQLAARDPALVPAYEEAARALGVQVPAPSRQQSLPAPQP